MLDEVIDVAVHELFMQGALDGVDKCFSGAVGAKSRTQWFEEEGGGVHLSGQGGLEVEQLAA